jgi:prepilin-type N-terminal cleavage/methylation domain-containing protein
MKNKGFTVIELIIIIAIIAILAAAIFVAIDPAQKINSTRNEQRINEVEEILNAVKTYESDNQGINYEAIDSMYQGLYYVIGTCSSGATCATKQNQQECVDLSLIGSKYLTEVPKDPKNGTDLDTNYFIMKDTTGKITVGACEPEGEGSGGTGTAPMLELSK